MSELRDRLAESITDAIETILDQHEFTTQSGQCSCGLRNNMDGDVLDLHRISLVGEAVRNTLATPGIAVVELPEPHRSPPMPFWNGGEIRTDGRLVVMGDYSLTVSSARGIAADLLAAADYLERDQ